MMDKLNTSYNKLNVNIVASFVGGAAIWILNTKMQMGIPDFLAVSGQGAIQAILTWLVPNAEV